MVAVKENCDMINCNEKAVGWMPVLSEDSKKIVGRINFCINHKQDCLDEFRGNMYFSKPRIENN